MLGIKTQNLAKQLAQRLIDRKRTLSVAESCTGGLLGGALTALPGTSAIYLGGACLYSNDAKEFQLGVPKELMIEHGSVSEATSLEMARRIRQAFSADIGLSITGIAGPGGGSENKPVGLVHIAAVSARNQLHKQLNIAGNRDQVREGGVQASLGLLELLLSLEP